MKILTIAVIWCLYLAAAALEAYSIYEIWNGSWHWAAIFAIITALNVRAVALRTKN